MLFSVVPWDTPCDVFNKIVPYYVIKFKLIRFYFQPSKNLLSARQYRNRMKAAVDAMLKQPHCPFVLYVGSKKWVKRKEFEACLRSKLII